MKTMIFAAAAALSLGIGTAYADQGDETVANTLFTSIPGVVAQVPAQNAPAAATAQSGQAGHQVYVTRSNQGTWLFPPNSIGGNG